MALRCDKFYKHYLLDEFRVRSRFGKKRKSMAAKPVAKLQGVDDELLKLLKINIDQAPARRRVRGAFKETQLGIDHVLFKFPCDGLKMEELYEVNSKGSMIFSKSWIPKEPCLPKAVVCIFHGYGDTCTFFLEGVARKIATSGYAVFAMDFPGFGLSDGLHGHIPSFDMLVDDVIEHFSKIKQNPIFCNLPRFLFGESMGGALALKMHLKQPDEWNGAILVAPMCKIADDMIPPRFLTQALIGLSHVIPKKKLVPQNDLAEMAFRDLKKREQAAYNVISYKDKPRLRTAFELLKTTQDITRQLESVSLPLFILHGESDTITDPSVSKELYEQASSTDKKLKLYKDAYHALLQGEPDEIILCVFYDIITWLDEHCNKINDS